MNRTTLTALIHDLAVLKIHANPAELAEVGQLLVNGGDDVALSIGEIADAIRGQHRPDYRALSR